MIFIFDNYELTKNDKMIKQINYMKNICGCFLQEK